MNYNFSLLNPASTTADMPQNLAATAGSTAAGVWPPAIILIGVLLGFAIIEFVISMFENKRGSRYPEGVSVYDPKSDPQIQRSETDIVKSKEF